METNVIQATGRAYAAVLHGQLEGGFTITVPDLPGCISEGDTLEECQANIAEAMELWLEVAQENGDPIPAPKPIILSSVQVTVPLSA